jgi:hypothetical protein
MTKSQRNGTLCKINKTQEKEPMAGIVIAMFTTVLRVIERRLLIWVCMLGTQTVPYTLSMVSREVLNFRLYVGSPITSTILLVIRREFLNLSVFWETDKHPFQSMQYTSKNCSLAQGDLSLKWPVDWKEEHCAVDACSVSKLLQTSNKGNLRLRNRCCQIGPEQCWRRKGIPKSFSGVNYSNFLVLYQAVFYYVPSSKWKVLQCLVVCQTKMT